MLNNAVRKYNATEESYGKYSRDKIETWIALVSIYKDYIAAQTLATNAHNAAGSSAYNTASAEEKLAADAINKVRSAIKSYRDVGFVEKSVTTATANSAIALYNEGATELGKYIAGNPDTYRHPINAISKFKEAYNLALKAYQLLLADAKENAASEYAKAKVQIDAAKGTPGIDKDRLRDLESRFAALETRFATAQTLEDFIDIAKGFSDVESRAKELIAQATPTPTPTPFPLFQLIIIVILLILLIFLIVYVLIRRRRA
jgi:CHASE3 domain sensor protein